MAAAAIIRVLIRLLAAAAVLIIINHLRRNFNKSGGIFPVNVYKIGIGVII